MSNSTIDNGQTCLEKKGMSMRDEHLKRNKWYNSYEYTKAMIADEYNTFMITNSNISY